MWASGVFGEAVDSALMIAVLCLCAVAAWRAGRQLGAPRFRGAIGMFWLVALVGLPIPLYLACGLGLWTGLLLFEALGWAGPLGAAAGWLAAPSLLCVGVLAGLRIAFTAPRAGE